VIVADRLPFRFPVMVTLRVEVTTRVVTVKVADVMPALTATELGTVAIEVLLLERLTEIPFDGAGPLSVIVPVDGVPPLTVEGLSVSEATLGADTVSLWLLVVPP
jgi:hypothetical protein